MGTQLVRKSSYLLMAVLLVAVVVALVASYNVRTVHAGGGGGPQPLYILISTEIGANATFEIFTDTAIAGIKAYTVHSMPAATGYYVSLLGTDFICITKATDPAKIPLCLPYSEIAGLRYH